MIARMKWNNSLCLFHLKCLGLMKTRIIRWVARVIYSRGMKNERLCQETLGSFRSQRSTKKNNMKNDLPRIWCELQLVCQDGV
jgi:hypothetical protein